MPSSDRTSSVETGGRAAFNPRVQRGRSGSTRRVLSVVASIA